ncbi:orotate phosphoribosyltransferase [bacterium 336/3]|nr:orotate phosphoribosyltransferase [bacterium 336/3]
MENVAHKIASLLLEIQAVKLSPNAPFKWSSGWLSPIYCDNRLTLSYPETRTYIKNAFVDLIKAKFADVEAIAGVATAGIPQGALIADAMGLPFVYVRSEAKKHGMTNLIEGKVEPNQKIVVIEDLISTGGSSLKVVDALREANCDVLGLVAIMTYGFEVAIQAFEEKNVPFYTLSNYNFVLDEALKQNIIDTNIQKSLEEWRKEPSNWQGI